MGLQTRGAGEGVRNSQVWDMFWGQSQWDFLML